MRVIHIANWFPSPEHPYVAPFINEHFEATNNQFEQELWHVQVRESRALWKLKVGSYGHNKKYLLIDTRIGQSRIIEVLTLLLLIFLRIRLISHHWDLVNVHIAYPLLRFPRFFQTLFGPAVVITEHWSAYRRNFNLPEGSKGKTRLQNMFRHGLPVSAVSNALMQDIVDFSGTDNFRKYVVPNVVDPTVFFLDESNIRTQGTFLMIANWAPIKRPMLVLAAINELRSTYPEVKLRIVGEGFQSKAMRDYVSDNDLANYVTFLGSLPKQDIAREMRRADAFLHSSDYETFSVVCAEALYCGLPVIASNVGGIPEFVGHNNGILVANNESAWLTALQDYLGCGKIWDRRRISEEANGRFSPDVVGKKIAEMYSNCYLDRSA